MYVKLKFEPTTYLFHLGTSHLCPMSSLYKRLLFMDLREFHSTFYPPTTKWELFERWINKVACL